MLLLCLTGCADHLLLFPSTGLANAGTAKRREIVSHGQTIELFTARSPGARSGTKPQALVLEFCGNASRAEHVTEYIANRWGYRPVEVYVMNYPGFGRSAGAAKLSSIPPAALAAYDDIAARAQGIPIVVAGNSLGTAAALYVAAKRPVAAIILQNPPPLHQMIFRKYGIFSSPVIAQIPAELDSIANAKRVKAPAVFVLSGQDVTVEPRYQQMIVDAYAGEKHLIKRPAADHNSPITGEADRQLQSELDWIWRQTVDAKTPSP